MHHREEKRAPQPKPCPGGVASTSPASAVNPSSWFLAYGLELLTFFIVGGQQEGPVVASLLPPAQGGTRSRVSPMPFR